jgi:hypothetical protein
VDHPDTLYSSSNLARAYAAGGRHAEAVALHEQTLQARERVLGPNHPDTRQIPWLPLRVRGRRQLCNMTDDHTAPAKMSALFDPEPQTWGLRGDSHLWRALRAHLADTDIPPLASEVASLLHAAFRELAGTDLTSNPASSLYREQYAHGGMSSGMISLDTWRGKLIPMLAERARTLTPD